MILPVMAGHRGESTLESSGRGFVERSIYGPGSQGYRKKSEKFQVQRQDPICSDHPAIDMRSRIGGWSCKSQTTKGCGSGSDLFIVASFTKAER